MFHTPFVSGKYNARLLLSWTVEKSVVKVLPCFWVEAKLVTPNNFALSKIETFI